MAVTAGQVCFVKRRQALNGSRAGMGDTAARTTDKGMHIVQTGWKLVAWFDPELGCKPQRWTPSTDNSLQWCGEVVGGIRHGRVEQLVTGPHRQDNMVPKACPHSGEIGPLAR
jgi:hypothetical protein